MESSQKRTLVITGANKGIGYAVVDRLLSEPTPFTIILTSRNQQLGEEAVKALQTSHPNSTSSLVYAQLDLNDEKSQQHFAEWLQKTYGKFDILLNNAGIAFWSSTDEQKRLTFKTNFTDTISLTEKLLPLLTDDGKVIFVSSILGSLAAQGEKLKKFIGDEKVTEQQLFEFAQNLDNISDYPGTYTPESSYPASKALLNAWVAKFLESKLKPNQQGYTLHPGWVQTDLGGKQAPLTVAEGADTPVYLINLPFKRDPALNVKFFDQRKVIPF